jgi:hypothetical protein
MTSFALKPFKTFKLFIYLLSKWLACSLQKSWHDAIKFKKMKLTAWQPKGSNSFHYPLLIFFRAKI